MHKVPNKSSQVAAVVWNSCSFIPLLQTKPTYYRLSIFPKMCNVRIWIGILKRGLSVGDVFELSQRWAVPVPVFSVSIHGSRCLGINHGPVDRKHSLVQRSCPVGNLATHFYAHPLTEAGISQAAGYLIFSRDSNASRLVQAETSQHPWVGLPWNAYTYIHAPPDGDA